MNRLPIWIVGGDVGYRRRVAGALKNAGAVVMEVTGSETAIDRASSRDPVLVVVCALARGGDAVAVCSQMRAAGYRRPVLVVTPKPDPEWQLALLDAGATEVLSSGEDLILIVSAVRELLRVTFASEERRARKVGDVILDLITREVRHGDRQISLTRTQFSILRCLAERPGERVSRDVLMNAIMTDRDPEDEEPDRSTLASHVSHLRGKLRGTTLRIAPVHGFGYRLYDDGPLISDELFEEVEEAEYAAC